MTRTTVSFLKRARTVGVGAALALFAESVAVAGVRPNGNGAVAGKVA